ncbi:MAG: HK97-gp10 family putative phage morphogenesis protein [Erysipelotrichaceae bacterium]|jgi:HK97 gp10 family phage protein
MAKAYVKLPDDFLEKISRLGSKTDVICEKMLKAGGEVVLSRVKSNLSSVIGSGTKYKSRSTGELERALGLSKVRIDKNGNYNIKIGFAESRKDGSSNAKLANIIEYGKSGQVAKPFMKPAKASSKSKCVEVMKSTFDKEVNNT